MTNPSSSMTAHRTQLNLWDKTATFGSWLLAGAIFVKIGWLAMEPDDPQGAVSVLARHGPITMLFQAGVLAAVAAALATVIAGRRLADVGTFAAAVGLMAVSLRGSTATSLLLEHADLSPTAPRGLAIKFALETVGWFALVLVAITVSAAVMRWFFGKGHADDRPGDDLLAIAMDSLAGNDLPRFGSQRGGEHTRRHTATRDGVKHALIAAGVGLISITVLSRGLYTRSIEHGQACFVVAAGVCVASYFAYRFVPVRSSLWSILAVPLMAFGGYLWASVRPAHGSLPPGVPASHFLRVLPIQFISVGTAAALSMFWSMHHPVPEGKGSGRS